MKQTPIQFSLADLGAAVVFAGFDGGSYSATVVEVRSSGPPRDHTVRLRYFPVGPEPVHATLIRADWGRLTRFPKNSKFLAI